MTEIWKENPDFFNCDCGEHFVIQITDSMRAEVQELLQDSNEIDTTDSRSERRSKKDSFIGKLAEIVVQEFFTVYDMQTVLKEGWEKDMIIGGQSAEIKARDYSQTASQYCDLLVRDRVDTNWTPADVDIIIQVMVDGQNSEKAYITGFCTGEYASECGFFEKAKTHRTREVLHSNLKPIEKLL